MEGVVDEILRDVLTGVGGIDWCVTEFIRVNSQLLPVASFTKLAPELVCGARTRAGTPVRVQLLGSDPHCLAENAALACELGAPVIDLDYLEDSNAGTDANFVMTGQSGIVEIQGTAEGHPFSQEEFLSLMALARGGIDQLVDLQKKAVA